MKYKRIIILIGICVLVGVIFIAGGRLWVRRVRVLPVVNAKIVIDFAPNIKAVIRVEPHNWEVDEEIYCYTMDSAVEGIYPMLLCGGAATSWNEAHRECSTTVVHDFIKDCPEMPKLKRVNFAEPMVKAIEGEERWFPVRFVYMGHSLEPLGKGYVRWICAKHVDGVIACK